MPNTNCAVELTTEYEIPLASTPLLTYDQFHSHALLQSADRHVRKTPPSTISGPHHTSASTSPSGIIGWLKSSRDATPAARHLPILGPKGHTGLFPTVSSKCLQRITREKTRSILILFNPHARPRPSLPSSLEQGDEVKEYDALGINSIQASARDVSMHASFLYGRCDATRKKDRNAPLNFCLALVVQVKVGTSYASSNL